jgi:integrase
MKKFCQIQKSKTGSNGLTTFSGSCRPCRLTGEPYISRQRWLPRLCRKAEVKEFGLHGIRHLSASILMANNVSLIDVQTILRHENLTTTQRYVHRLESVMKVVELFR